MPLSRTRHPIPASKHRRRWGSALLVTTVTLLSLLGSTVPSAITARAGAVEAHTAGPVSAYWLVAADGGIFSFGGAPFYGSTGGMHLNQPIVGMAAAAGSGGYWLVAADGGVFSFGDAPFYGSTGGMHLNQPVVGMAAAPNNIGYWLVAADGGIFTFGTAGFYGSMGGQHLNQPIVGMASTPDGGGYWLVAADGGIFSFGDAHFYGSTGGMRLNKPIVGMTATPNGGGYWFTASDGGVFAFGDAVFYGSLGGSPQSRPIAAIASDASGNGYWITNNNGAVSQFGGAGYWGSAPQVLNRPVVGMAEADATGQFSGGPYQSGSYGYDVSVYTCGHLPPAPYTIGVVEVDGNGQTLTSPNPCLAQEAAWAGAGLNLYDYLYYGTSPSGPGVCLGDQACNFGYQQAQSVFGMAQSAGINTAVTWWLDVEGSWSGSTYENSELVQGAILGIRGEGINNVGIYASPGVWNNIVGPAYAPQVPYWMAWYSGGGGPYNCANIGIWTSTKNLPEPLVMTQYQSVGGYDYDYAC